MLNAAQLEGIVARIVAGYDPDVVGVFGSYAIGNATDRSDLDLVVIKRTHEAPYRRAAQVARLVPTMYKLDVVVLTPEEFGEAPLRPHSFHRTISQQVKVLYARAGLRWR